jgi:hypothetical protein
VAATSLALRGAGEAAGAHRQRWAAAAAWAALRARALALTRRRHQADLARRRSLFRAFTRRVRQAQAVATRTDRRGNRAGKHHARRRLQLCFRLWLGRKHRADRSILATAALSRTSARLLREEEKARRRERALLAKFR